MRRGAEAGRERAQPRVVEMADRPSEQSFVKRQQLARVKHAVEGRIIARDRGLERAAILGMGNSIQQWGRGMQSPEGVEPPQNLRPDLRHGSAV